MTKELKQIEKFLKDNNIDYDFWTFGGDYFGPLYTWQGVHVSFDYDGIENTREKRATFEKFINRKHKNISVKRISGGVYVSYRIFYTPDFEALEKYEAAKSAAVNNYWQGIHAARLASNVA